MGQDTLAAPARKDWVQVSGMAFVTASGFLNRSGGMLSGNVFVNAQIPVQGGGLSGTAWITGSVWVTGSERGGSGFVNGLANLSGTAGLYDAQGRFAGTV